MRIRFLIVLFIILVCFSTIRAYETNSMFNTIVPSDLTLKQFDFRLSHRFQGNLKEDSFDSFFGMHGGASVALGLRAGLIRGFEINWQYLYFNRDMSFGIAKNILLPASFTSRIEIKSHTYRPVFYLENRESIISYLLVLQYQFLNNKLQPILNIQYDDDNENVGTGYGINYQMTEKLGLILEVFPRRDSESLLYTRTGFSYGFRVNTYGHRFLFVISNSRDAGIRNIMRGSDTKDLYFGFSIHRLVEIY